MLDLAVCLCLLALHLAFQGSIYGLEAAHIPSPQNRCSSVLTMFIFIIFFLCRERNMFHSARPPDGECMLLLMLLSSLLKI